MSAVSVMARGASLYSRYEKSQKNQNQMHNQNIMEQTAAQTVVKNIKQAAVLDGAYTSTDQDALFSIKSARTGESVSIYRSDSYSEELPIYLLKGTYQNGKNFEKEIAIEQIDPYHCTYLGFLTLSVHTSQENAGAHFSKLAKLDERIGAENFFSQEDYMSAAADLMNEQKKTGDWGSYLDYSNWIHNIARCRGCMEPEGRASAFDTKVDGRSAPYSSLADQNGDITYNGVEMHCDFKNNALCIGNISDDKNVLTIPLSKGGSLKINRDNLDCLPAIISMFSPEDRFLIMRAITLDQQIQKIKNDIDNEDFTDTETENYSITKDHETGDITIYDKQTDSKFVLHQDEKLNIQKDAVSGLSMLVQTGGNSSYQSILITQELEDALKTSFHMEELHPSELEGYSIQTDDLSGIQYLAKNGEDDRGIPFLDEKDRIELLTLADRVEEGEESEQDAFSRQQIMIKPDGTRILVLTTNINGMQAVMTLKLSEKEIPNNPSSDRNVDTEPEENLADEL